jgi:hypothetical protein
MTTILKPADPPLPLGEFLSSAGLVPPDQVKYALDLQRATGERLGEVLVRQAAIDPKDVAAVVEVQQQVRQHLSQDKGHSTHALPECLSVGELLVARGDVSRAVLNQALQNKPTDAELGDVLLEMGAVQPETLSHVVPLQKRLLSAVLCAGLGFAFAFATQTARAAGSGSSRLLVTATVPRNIQLTTKSHPAGFTVTEQDIARGYVEVAQASVFDIKTNSAEGVAVEFHGLHNGGVIQSVQITGGASNFQMPASGGVMLIQGGWHPTVARSFGLRYRLNLGPNAQPGVHPWPFLMSVSAL